MLKIAWPGVYNLDFFVFMTGWQYCNQLEGSWLDIRLTMSWILLAMPITTINRVSYCTLSSNAYPIAITGKAQSVRLSDLQALATESESFWEVSHWSSGGPQATRSVYFTFPTDANIQPAPSNIYSVN